MGVWPMIAAVTTLRRAAVAPVAAVIVGLLLIGWIVVEMVMLGGPQTVAWGLYLILGTVIATVGVTWIRSPSR